MGAAVGIAYLYEDELKAYAVEQLNAQLATEVDIEDIQLSLLQRFPSASVEFTEVVMKGNHTEQESDTLLYASSILMKFNVWDLWDENYRVKEIEVSKAELNVYVAEDGTDNFHVFKPLQDSLDDTFEFELENIWLQETDVRYVSLTNGTTVEFLANNINLDGQFSQSQFDLQNNSDIYMKELTAADFTYVTNRNVNMDVNLHVNYDTQEYLINRGGVAVEDMNFDVTGKVTGTADYTDCDLTINGNQLHLQSLASILPDHVRKKLTAYHSSGVLDMNATIVGAVSPQHTPDIKATFGISNGSATETGTNITLNNIQLAGTYHNRMEGREENLDIPTCSASLKGKPLELSVSVTNFSDPFISFKAKGDVDLAEVQKFTRIESVEHMAGDAQFDIGFKGKLDQLNNYNQHFNEVKMHGSVAAQQAELRLNDSPITYQLDSADGQFVKNVLTVNATGMAGSSHVSAQGVVQNLLNYLFFQEPLAIDAQIDADHVDLPEFIKDSEKPVDSDHATNVNFNVNLAAREVSYGKFNATDLKSVFTWQNKVLIAKNVSFHSAGGSVSGNLELDMNSNEYPMVSNAQFTNIAIDQVFHQFNDFSQSFITEDQLKGTANAQISFKGNLDKNYRVLQKSVESVADIEINNGQLVGQQALMDIADYMRESAYTKVLLNNHIDDFEERMKRVQFDQLKNQITVSNGRVHVPEMDIKSDALDIALSGDHSFTNEIDYRFNFRYRDLKKQQESEFGPIRDDGTGIRIFLAMTGTTTNPVFEIDKDSRKEETAEKLEEEKATLKSILHEEFGLFKNDSTVKPHAEPEKVSPTFIIDWEEMEKEEQIEPEKDNKTRFDKFLNNLGIHTEDEDLYEDEDF